MTVSYFINGMQYLQISDKQKRQITEKLAKAFGLTPVDSKQGKKQAV